MQAIRKKLIQDAGIGIESDVDVGRGFGWSELSYVHIYTFSLLLS